MPKSDLEISVDPPYVEGRAIGFSGWVDDFEHNIAAVQFSLDGGRHWTEYATPGATVDRGVRWKFVYTPQTAGRYLLSVRAVNGIGETSTLVSGYAFQVLGNDAEASFAPTRASNATAQCDVASKARIASSAPTTSESNGATTHASIRRVPNAGTAPLPFGSFHLRPIGEQHWGVLEALPFGRVVRHNAHRGQLPHP